MTQSPLDSPTGAMFLCHGIQSLYFSGLVCMGVLGPWKSSVVSTADCRLGQKPSGESVHPDRHLSSMGTWLQLQWVMS